MSLLPSKPDTSAVDDAEPRVIGVDSDDADDVISALSSETARKLLAELHQDPAPPAELSERVDTSLQNAQYHLEKLEAAGAVSVVDTAYSAKGREMDVYAPADQPLVIFAGQEERTTGLKAALSRLLGGVGVLALGSLAVQSLYGQADPRVQSSGGAAGGAGGSGNGGGASGNGAAPAGGADGGPPPETVTSAPQETEAGSGDVDTFDATAEDIPETTQAPDMAAKTSSGDGGYVLQSNTTNETIEMTSEEVARSTTTTTEAAQTTADTAGQATETAAQTTTAVAGEATDAAVQTTDAAASMAGLPPGLLFFAGGMLVLSLWLVVWYTSAE